MDRLAVLADHQQNADARTLDVIRDNDAIGTWTWYPATNQLILDAHSLTLFGLNAATFDGTINACFAMTVAEDLPVVRQRLAEAAAHGTVYHSEFRICRPDSTLRWVLSTAQPSFDSSGAVNSFHGVHFDITARKHTEAMFHEREAHYRMITELSSHMIWMLASDGEITYLSQQWFDYTGLQLDEAQKHGWLSVVHPDEHEQISAEFEQFLMRGSAYTIELRLKGRDGTYRWHVTRATPVKDAQGRVLKWLGITFDIEERKRAEATVRASEAQSRAILESITNAFFALDRDWRFTYVNRQAEVLVGHTASDLLGELFWNAFPGSADSEFERVYRQAMNEHVAASVTAFYPAHQRWYDVHAYPAPNGITISVNDITEQTLAMQALRISEERFRAVQETSVDGFMVFESVRDAADRIVDFRWAYVNEAAERIVGKPRDMLVGRCLLVEMPGNREEGLFDAYVRVVMTGEPWTKEFTYQHEGIDAYIRLVAAKAGDGFAVSFADLSEQRRAESRVRESEQRYRNLLASIDQGFCVFELLYDATETPIDYRFLEVNPMFERHTGLHDVVGKTISELVPGFEQHWFAIFGQVAATGETVRLEQQSAVMGRWFEMEAVRVGGVGSRKVALLFADITERKQTESDNRFLAALSERIRVSEDADSLLADVAHMTGEHMQAWRCYFVEVDEAADSWTVRSDYGPPPSMSGTYRLSTYPEDMLVLHRRGRIISIRDTEHDPLVSASYEAGFAPFGIRAITIVPLLRYGRWVSELVIGTNTVRHWLPRELTLLETIADRTWNACEKLRLEAEQRDYTARLHQLNTASLAINAAPSRDAVLQLTLSEARQLIGANQAVVNLVPHGDWSQTQTIAACAEPSSAWQTSADEPAGRGISQLVYNERQTLRLTQAELDAHPAWQRYDDGQAACPALNGILAVPLTDSHGVSVGVIRLSDKNAGVFTVADEALLQQLAQLASVALENQTLYEQALAMRAQAEAASRLKDEFLATISHELRTPLTAVLGYAQLLQTRKRDEGYIARTLEKMVRSAQVQAKLIEDLLDVSRIVNGNLRLDMQPVNISTIIQAALDTVRPTIEAKGLQLIVDLNPSTSRIVGDPNRLQQIVWNLLTNATKFTPTNGRISVQLQPQGHVAQLTVSDTGQGISAAFLPFVFDRFRQADSTNTRAHSGLGLGLAIVRHLVELHGGTVAVASAGEDQGATFTVELPLLLSDDEATGPHDRAVEDAAVVYPPELRGLRILLVDDQPDILELLQDMLVPSGAVIKPSSTVGEALALIPEWRPDVVVSDIAMPEYDGYWLIQQLRMLPPERGGHTPAIALTAYVHMEARLRVLEAGFQQYVPKPVDPNELRAVIASVVR